MKKTYCDVCGIECDDVEKQNAIELAYPIDENEKGEDVDVLTLPDMCWDCRGTIAFFIKKRMKDAKKTA